MAKKVLMLLAVLFAAFFLLREPEAAANMVQGSVAWLSDAFGSLARFVTELFD